MFQKTTKFKAIIKGFFGVGLFLVIMSFFIPGIVWAINTLLTGYSVSSALPRNIDHSALCTTPCKTVTVSGGRTYFIPTLSCREWQDFRDHKPADVTVTDCATPACSAFTTCGQTCSYRGKNYRTVVIGSQCWFKDDLKTREFPDTSAITQWNYGVPVASWYDRFGCTGTTNNCPDSDLFYQSLAALPADGWLDNPTATGKQGSCPGGWRVPSEADMDTFETAVSSCLYGGGFSYVYTASCLNTSYGFNATAYGMRSGSSGTNFYTGDHAFYLMSNYTISGNKKVYSFADVSFNGSTIGLSNTDISGFSVRCIKSIGGGGSAL
jgi:uncharacterized protein (TIGR02145 family)